MKIFNLHIYQILVIVVSLIMIYQGFSNMKKGGVSQTLLKFIVRVFVWGGMATIALYPQTTTILAKSIGIVDNMNAVILTGFLLIFLIIFKLLSAIERLEQKIVELAQKEALRDLNKKND